MRHDLHSGIKLCNLSAVVLCPIGGIWIIDWAVLDSIGFPGSQLIGWCQHITCLYVDFGCSLNVQLLDPRSNKVWFLSSCYGPTNRAPMSEFLQEIHHACVWATGPWVITEDFNITRCSKDRRGTENHLAEMDLFNDTIHDP